jgi:hypothetical protein
MSMGIDELYREVCIVPKLVILVHFYDPNKSCKQVQSFKWMVVWSHMYLKCKYIRWTKYKSEAKERIWLVL